jgi:DNA-binding MarR family transcriptional regulator
VSEKPSYQRSLHRPKRGDGGLTRPDSFRLFRYSHIFAAAVREILEVRFLREATELPLTLSQFHLLKLMAVNGQHQVGEVADFLGVSPPAATKNIDKLERLGLVIRMPSPGDRRATLLSVSPKGRRLVKGYERLKTARVAPVLEGFEPEELEQFSRLLERFAVALLSLSPGGDGFCLRCAAYLAAGCPVGEVRGGCPYEKMRASRQVQLGREEVP